jgi:hypothetical protein
VILICVATAIVTLAAVARRRVAHYCDESGERFAVSLTPGARPVTFPDLARSDRVGL